MSLPVFFHDLLLKVISGNVAAAKKLVERKSSSRIFVFVVMLATSMTASNGCAQSSGPTAARRTRAQAVVGPEQRLSSCSTGYNSGASTWRRPSGYAADVIFQIWSEPGRLGITTGDASYEARDG